MSGTYKQGDKSIDYTDLHDLLIHETPAQQERRKVLCLIREIDQNIDDAFNCDKAAKKLIKYREMLKLVTDIGIDVIKKISKFLNLSKHDINPEKIYDCLVEQLVKKTYAICQNFNLQIQEISLFRDESPLKSFPKDSYEDTRLDYTTGIEKKIKEIEKHRNGLTEAMLEKLRILEVDLVPGWFMQTREFSPEEIPPHSEAQDLQPEALEPALQTRDFPLEEETPPHSEAQASQPIKAQDWRLEISKITNTVETKCERLKQMTSSLLSRSVEHSPNFRLVRLNFNERKNPSTQPSTFELPSLPWDSQEESCNELKKQLEDDQKYSQLVKTKIEAMEVEIKKAEKQLRDSFAPLEPSEDPKIANILQTEINNFIHIFIETKKSRLKLFEFELKRKIFRLESLRKQITTKHETDIYTIETIFSQDKQDVLEDIESMQKTLVQRRTCLEISFSALLYETEELKNLIMQDYVSTEDWEKKRVDIIRLEFADDEKNATLAYTEGVELYPNDFSAQQEFKKQLEIDLQFLERKKKKFEEATKKNAERKQEKLKKNLEELEKIIETTQTKNKENLDQIEAADKLLSVEMQKRLVTLEQKFEDLKKERLESKNAQFKELDEAFELSIQEVEQKFLYRLKISTISSDQNRKAIESRIERIRREAVIIQIPPEILDTLDRVPSKLDRILTELPPKPDQIPSETTTQPTPAQAPATLTRTLVTSTRAALPTLSQMPPLTQVSLAPTKKTNDHDRIICPSTHSKPGFHHSRLPK
ncbi:MAG: hypothetical protein LBJ09_00230 [Clostridiales bacterium]|jgi:hypothetical protein|nr:hypothetical protein [Clostridiales bacterium]